MLISIKKEFCFIANTKAASTSIENALQKYSEIRLTGTPALKHMPLRELECSIAPFLAGKGVNIERFYKFSVIREPVSWLVSWFNYHSLAMFKDKKIYLGDIDFDSFLKKVFNGDFLFISKGQSVRFISDNYQMDKLICFENLSKKLEYLSGKLDIDLVLGHQNISSQKRITSNDLSSFQKSEIRIFFRKDVALYNYWLSK